MLFAKLSSTSVVRGRNYILLFYQTWPKCLPKQRSPCIDRQINFEAIHNTTWKRHFSSTSRLFTHQPIAKMELPGKFLDSPVHNQLKIISPPDRVKGMKTLDYDLFKKIVQIPYVMVNTNQIANVRKVLQPFYLKMPNFKPVVADDSVQDLHQIFLDPDLYTERDVEAKLKQIESSLIPISSQEPTKYVAFRELTLEYKHFNQQTIFRAIFPSEVDTISGFSIIGHIIHLNLRDEVLSYKHLIGQVLLDKIKGCRLVINKLNTIDNQFRNFAMETLAKDANEPEPTTIVSTTECDIRFNFDFSKVYWNPRLSAERTRINSKLNHSVDILYDVFAGVGPFALNTAKLVKCQVLANDLNPESYRWLCENTKLNKLQRLITCSNLDGREFIQQTMKNDLIERVKTFNGTDANRRYHVVMNLPEIAVEFLDEFDGLLSSIRTEDYSYRIPQLDIHCYCFVKNIPESEAEEYVIKLASSKLGHELKPKNIDEVFYVRKVAPTKIMYRISFRLSSDILYGSSLAKQQILQSDCTEDQSAIKRHKAE